MRRNTGQTPYRSYHSTGNVEEASEAIVAKQLRRDGQRLLLIESVPYASLQSGFQGLPPCVLLGHASAEPKSKAKTAYAAIASPPRITKAGAPPRKSETGKLTMR